MKFHTDFKIGIRFAILITVFLMLIHWVACLFYKLAQADYTYSLIDNEVKNLRRILSEGDFYFDYWVPPPDLGDGKTDFYLEPLYLQYIKLVYFSILLIVGNDICPQTGL